MNKEFDIKRLRKDISFQTTLRGFNFTFNTTWGTFSPRSIDEGSIMLLDRMEINENDNCLDLGCGYGPIGLTMAKLAPNGHTTLVDRDFVAVDYSNKNAQQNNINNASALLSNGFSNIHDQKFDVIASNIPAKVGNEMLTIFLHDAYQQLNEGGQLYIVTITGLRKYMERNFKEIFGNYKKLKQGNQYTVALAVKTN